MAIRFSVNLSPEQVAWVGKLTRAFNMSAADVIRRLIQKEMESHRDPKTGKLPPSGFVGNPFGWGND